MEQAALLDPVSPPVPVDSQHGDSDLFGRWIFEVPGEAVPQGSMKALISATTGHAMLKPSNEKALKAWRKTVADHAAARKPPWLRRPWDGPIFISLLVIRERGDDYLADGTTLKRGARRYPDTAPDSDKLERAIFDALTGIAFTNDGRVVTNLTTQRYAGPGGKAKVEIEIGFLRP